MSSVGDSYPFPTDNPTLPNLHKATTPHLTLVQGSKKSMTDTNRHDKPADRRDWRHLPEHLAEQSRQIRAGQGQLLLYSQFPEPDVRRSNQRGYHLRRPTP